MKSYISPTLVARGDVVSSTMINKQLFTQEVGATKRPSGGPSLSFGL